ncbi:Ig-like domain-containing protein [Anaerobutyricum hallii]|uniref:Ig-like domain-containing protein n=1 Tax=Anaerobutyricum hallii TaxID=39488 RepID=UPI002675E22B|nr:Ig-like domain-containing protein [Anaerobutyricum hallii]
MKTKATSRIFKQTFAWILTFVMMLSILPATQVNAATKPKLSKTKITMTVGQSKKLTVKGISKKQAKRIKWKSSSKKVVTVTKTGKIKARKTGKATITAKVGKKKLKCKVTVKKSKKSTKKKESNSSSKKMWLSKTSVTLQAGSGVDLVLHNAKNVVKWSSSNKKVAWVERDTTYKNHGAVQAAAKGTTVITAKVDGKTFKCHVKVIADDYHASEATEAKIKQALKIVNNSMSTQEKVLKLTIWTCDHLKRVYGEYWSYEPENTVNCILKGKATRYGYNDFLDELLSSAGIKTMYVNESYGGARLKVSIDGKWYNLDVYRMDPSTQDSSGHGLWSYSMPFFLFSDAEAYKYHSQYYSKPSKEFEKYNPPATSTRFDFVKETYNNAKIAEDTDLLTVAYYKSDWVSYTYEEALQEDLINCANGLFNKYNPWVTGTWRNY